MVESGARRYTYSQDDLRHFPFVIQQERKDTEQEAGFLIKLKLDVASTLRATNVHLRVSLHGPVHAFPQRLERQTRIPLNETANDNLVKLKFNATTQAIDFVVPRFPGQHQEIIFLAVRRFLLSRSSRMY